MNSSRWKVWLAAIVLFLAGVAVGSVVTVGVGLRLMRAAIHATATTPAPVDRSMVRLHRILTRDLELDDAQSKQVREELDRTALDLKQLRGSTAQHTRVIIRETLARIAADLPPDKREKFRALAVQRLRRVGFEPEQTPEK